MTDTAKPTISKAADPILDRGRIRIAYNLTQAASKALSQVAGEIAWDDEYKGRVMRQSNLCAAQAMQISMLLPEGESWP